MLNYFGSLNILTLLKAIPGNISQGLIWGVMALGLYISFRVLNFSDLTVDGSLATGACVTVVLIIKGVSAPLALVVAFFAGALTGFTTGILNTVLHIAPILASILTQISLYSINLHILGNKANLAVNVNQYDLLVSLRNVNQAILIGIIIVAIIIAFFYWFFGTEIGSAIRATGNNEQMARAQGINTNVMKVIALSLSNGIVAVSGGLLAQYLGYADVSIGRGAIVIGLAAIIIGEVISNGVSNKITNFAFVLACAAIGGIIYYFFMGVAIWLKLPSNDLKLFTAIIVAVFLSISGFKKGAK